MSASDRNPVITLLSDYGAGNELVGALHGVIARICPQAHVIDLSHAVAPQNVRGGADVLAQALRYAPLGVHVAIVDPAVGGERRAVALRCRDRRILVGPDNGLLWPACQAGGGVEHAVEISHSAWRLEPVSATFHGRDIFAPVAAHLAAGSSLQQAGEPLRTDLLVRLADDAARVADGVLAVHVLNIDRFGNVQLGARPRDLAELGARLGDRLTVSFESCEPRPATYARTFGDVAYGALVVFEDSARRLAIASNRGSAAIDLGLRAGDRVSLLLAGGR